MKKKLLIVSGIALLSMAAAFVIKSIADTKDDFEIE